MSAFFNQDRDELILFGGLGNGGPSPPTPMNHNVYTLNLLHDAAMRQWELRSTDAVVAAPWFTSTRGFVQVGGRQYVACDDSDEDLIYRFDRHSYTLSRLTGSTLPPQHRAGDCCAVGVDVWYGRAGQGPHEQRIYILGGRNSFASPVKDVRYYSIDRDRWEQAADLHVGRSHLGCASAVQQGRPFIYAIGGGNSPAGAALRSLEVYDVLQNQWTLYDDALSAGRTRMGVQNVDDQYLLLIGGDASCAGGGAGNRCPGDQPVSAIEIIDLVRPNRPASSLTAVVPQLRVPRATPATVLRKLLSGYELYVIGGRTASADGLAVGQDTEMLTFSMQHLNLWQ